MIKKIIPLLIIGSAFASCKTTIDLEKTIKTIQPVSQITEVQVEKEQPALSVVETIIEPRIVYVEKPIYVPMQTNTAPLAGKDAVKQNLSDVQKQPQYENGRLRSYRYQDDWVYEIHCQTYHTTDIQLEPGEEVLETPYISEPDVWQMSAGVSRKDGKHVQHFFIKPDFNNLRSNLIIVTNRRVYHMELRSFNDYYMPIVRWTYPSIEPMRIYSSIPDKSTEVKKQEQKESFLETFGIDKELINDLAVSDETLSADYQMKVNKKKSPLWTPTAVFDDGKKTFIVLDKKSLQIEYPALFNESKEIINYRTVKNVLVIDQLISTATLRLGKDTVIIMKKIQAQVEDPINENSLESTDE